jgi:hypothetical protein
MRRGDEQQTAGQVVYELCTSHDTTARHWPEWRALSGAEKEYWEEVVRRALQQLHEDQESSCSL